MPIPTSMTGAQVKRNASGNTANPKAPAPIEDGIDDGKDSSEDEDPFADADSSSVNTDTSDTSLTNYRLQRDAAVPKQDPSSSSKD